MRLIDADALMRDIEHYHLSDGKFQHWVEVQPTIEPEHPKGEWIMTKELDEDVATCTFCGAEMRRKSTAEKPEPPNFCSTCGADLRGGRNYATD